MFEMSKGLSASQLLTVVQGLQEQLKSQGRETPDVFGQRPLEGSGGKGSGGVPQLNFGLDAGAEMKHVDVFSKSEKWLGTPPVPSVASWTSRDAEVIGWSTYVSSLSAWQHKLLWISQLRFSRQVDGPLAFRGRPFNPKNRLELLDFMRF